MTTVVKIVLGALAAILLTVVCLAIGAFTMVRGAGNSLARNVETQPDKVAQAADQIAGFELPAGYEPQFGARFLGFSVASYTPTDPFEKDHGHLYLVQAPSYLNLDETALINTAGVSGNEGRRDPTTRLRLISETSTTVRGQPAVVILSEGISSDGTKYMSMNLIFEGEHGKALASITGSTSDWDQAACDAFIKSIK